MDLEVTELAPGELQVRADDLTCRILVPAGVGVAGFSDEELAAAFVAELLARSAPVPVVVDLSQRLATDPGMFAAVATRLEAGEA